MTAAGTRAGAAGSSPAGGFARDTAVLAVGLGVSQALMLAAMPLLARLYGPEAFAALGVWTAVAAVVGMLLLARYDSAIVVARDDDEARALRRLGLVLAGGGGALLVAAALLLPEAWRERLGLAPLGAWLPLAVAAGALAAVFASGLAALNRERAYARMSVARVLLAAVAVVAALAWGTWAPVPGPGLLIAQCAGAALALFALRWRLAPHSGVAAAARRHADAPRYLWPAAMLDTVTQQLPLLLTAAWFSAELAGQFSLAWRVLAVPAFVLAGAAGSVFFQRFASLVPAAAGAPGSADVAAAGRLMRRTWAAFALGGALPALLLLAFGEPLFGWLFGARWAVAGTLAAALAPMLLAMMISSPTSGALIVLGLQRWAPVFGVAMLLYRPAAFWLGAREGSLVLALALWAVAEIAAIVLYNRLLWRTLQRRAVAAVPAAGA